MTVLDPKYDDHPAIAPNLTMTKGTRPISVVCPRFDCFYRSGHVDIDSALTEWVRHQENECPVEGKSNTLMDERDEKGQRYTMVHVGKSILEQLWDDLDAAYDQYGSITDQMNAMMQQGLMRGIATAIHKMSKLYYPEVDDVVREELRRKSIRDGEIEWSPTFGYKYNPPPKGTKEYEKSLAKHGAAGPKDSDNPKPRKAAAAPAPEKRLSPEVDEKIRKAFATGLFEAADLAASFKVTVAYIKSLV